MEAGPIDEDGGGPLETARRNDAAWRDPRDLFGDERYVVARERRVVVVRDEDALAADGVVRHELCTQLGVAHRAAHVPQRTAPGHLHRPRQSRETERAGFVRDVLQRAAQPLQAGKDREGAAQPTRIGHVGARDHVRRRALVEIELAHLPRDLGNELNRARARADDGNPFARERDVVPPPR